MKNSNDNAGFENHSITMSATDFQLKLLQKLGQLEAKIDMIVGNGQPGRMKLVEDRVVALEKNDLRRTIYDRLITAVITFAISAVISWHDHLPFK
jgi:hypothetical protein